MQTYVSQNILFQCVRKCMYVFFGFQNRWSDIDEINHGNPV